MLIYVGININDLTTLYITVIVNELNHIVKCSQYILWYLRQPKIDCYAYMFSYVSYVYQNSDLWNQCPKIQPFVYIPV